MSSDDFKASYQAAEVHFTAFLVSERLPSIQCVAQYLLLR